MSTFLNKTFRSLTEFDFAKNSFLVNFYRCYIQKDFTEALKSVIEARLNAFQSICKIYTAYQNDETRTNRVVAQYKELRSLPPIENARDVVEFYLDFITRNSELEEDEKPSYLEHMATQIEERIAQAVDEPEEGGCRVVFIDKRETDLRNTFGKVSERVKKACPDMITKKVLLTVLVEFLESSTIRNEELEIKDADVEKDQKTRDNSSGFIMEDLLKEHVKLPVRIPDVEFARRNRLQAIWRDTKEELHDKLRENKDFTTLIQKLSTICYFGERSLPELAREYQKLDRYQDIQDGLIVLAPTAQDTAAGRIAGNPKEVINIRECNEKIRTLKTEMFSSAAALRRAMSGSLTTVQVRSNFGYSKYKEPIVLPSVPIVCKYTGIAYQTKYLQVCDTNAIDACIAMRNRKLRAAYVCAGSMINCGEFAKLGYPVVESELTMRSTYIMSLELAAHAFPLNFYDIVQITNVMIARSKIDAKLDLNSTSAIAVILSPTVYKPKTNIPDMDTVEFDRRLLSASCRMFPSEVYRMENKLRLTLEFALHLGYDCLVFDDLDIQGNWLPLCQTAEIMRRILREFSGRFNEITVCTSKPFNEVRFI